MRIKLHIERVVVEGSPIESHRGGEIGAAIEAELTRLLLTQGLEPRLTSELRSGVSIPFLQAGSFNMDRQSNAASLGGQIAQALHNGITTQNHR
jgi:hypothetical protein